jgi:hypothetical protein
MGSSAFWHVKLHEVKYAEVGLGLIF